MPTQVYSSQMVENLATAFPRRNDNSFAWGNAISYYLGLPQLRGFWPMSSVNESGNLYDMSGQSRTLTNTGTAPFAVYGLQSYTELDGATQYFTRADEAGTSITGALTAFAWMRPDNVAGVNQDVIQKYTTAGDQRSYRLTLTGSTVAAAVSSLGTAASLVTATSTVTPTTSWQFVAMRFVQSTSLTVVVNNTFTTNAVGIPAAIFDSTATFNIGYFPATGFFNGGISLCALCAAACSDAQINAVYWLTRSLFYGS